MGFQSLEAGGLRARGDVVEAMPPPEVLTLLSRAANGERPNMRFVKLQRAGGRGCASARDCEDEDGW